MVSQLEAGPHDPSGPPAMRLVQDIAAQHRHLAVEDGAARIVGHIVTFWDPRLRSELMTVVTPTGDRLIDAVLVALADR